MSIGEVALAATWPLWTLSGCQTLPEVSAQPPKPRIEFLDLQLFDREMNRSLSAPLNTVEVAFLGGVVSMLICLR